MNLILIKTIKGKATGSPQLFLNANERKLLAYSIFDVLVAQGPLPDVVGNLGFALASIVAFGREYESVMEKDVLASLKVLTNRDQSLNCMYFEGTEKHFQLLIDMDDNVPDRIL